MSRKMKKIMKEKIERKILQKSFGEAIKGQ